MKKISVNIEVKKLVEKVKKTQSQFQDLMKDGRLLKEAKRLGDQGQELKKLLKNDLSRVKSFVEKERKELEKFQKQIPSEIKKLKTFVQGRRSDLEKLLSSLKKGGAFKVRPIKIRRKGSKKSASAKKSAE